MIRHFSLPIDLYLSQRTNKLIVSFHTKKKQATKQKITLSVMKLKCVFLGDSEVGKTWIITTFITGENPNDQMPTIFDSFTCNIDLKGQNVDLSLWDTAGELKYDRIRQLSYPNTDMFFICYAINNVASFNNVKHWLNEIKELEIPAILVATKYDVRDDYTQQDIVTTEMGKKMAKEHNFVDFVETSALERRNLYLLFEKAVDHKMKKDKTFIRLMFEYLCWCCV